MDTNCLRILFVDDDPLVCESFAAALDGWGYDVETASNGREAYEMFTQRHFQLVITDLNMPKMDGLSLLRQLKKRDGDVDVIVLTGYATLEAAVEALKLGAVDFVMKPVDLEYLHLVVQKSENRIRRQMRSASFVDYANQLRELNEMKEKFISITNHEIRTPLTIIKGYLEMLKSDVGLEPGVRSMFQSMELTVRNLNHAVERMHMLDGITWKRWQMDDEEVDVSKVILETVANITPLFDRRHIGFACHVEDAIFIGASELAIQTLVTEILTNSLKFTRDGGEVTLAARFEGDALDLSIEDTGIGIAEEHRSKVCTDFYEVQESKYHHSSLSKFMGGGLGIGLHLVKEIIESLGGQLAINSELDKGTVVNIRIPKNRHLRKVAFDEARNSAS